MLNQKISCEMGLTQEELTERANLHPTYIDSVERGERNIALENIVAIAKALKCFAKELIFYRLIYFFEFK